MKYDKTETRIIKKYLADIYSKLCRVNKDNNDNKVKQIFIFNLYEAIDQNNKTKGDNLK